MRNQTNVCNENCVCVAGSLSKIFNSFANDSDGDGGYAVINEEMDNALQLCDPTGYRDDKYATNSSQVNSHAEGSPQILDHFFLYSRQGHYAVLEHRCQGANQNTKARSIMILLVLALASIPALAAGLCRPTYLLPLPLFAVYTKGRTHLQPV